MATITTTELASRLNQAFPGTQQTALQAILYGIITTLGGGNDDGTGVASQVVTLDSAGNFVMPTAGVFQLSTATLAAAGTTSANAAAIAAQITTVTASDNAKGVVLPAASTAATAGPRLIINTVQTASLKVYPVDGGNDNINNLAEDLPYLLGPGEQRWFVPVSGTQWWTGIADNGSSAISPTAARVLTAQESGTTVFLTSATGFAVTLPAVAAGLAFDFYVATAPTSGSHTIVAASGTPIVGHGLTTDVNSATDPAFNTSGVLTITLVVNKAVKGDRVRVVCDGTNWFAEAAVSVFDAVTFS